PVVSSQRDSSQFWLLTTGYWLLPTGFAFLPPVWYRAHRRRQSTQRASAAWSELNNAVFPPK
ncbi:MAG: hypothetical protein ACR2JW_17720, partial [Thermomicrobiales bacterium]